MIEEYDVLEQDDYLVHSKDEQIKLYKRNSIQEIIDSRMKRKIDPLSDDELENNWAEHYFDDSQKKDYDIDKFV